MRRWLITLLFMLCCGVSFAQQHDQQQLQKLTQFYNYLRSNYVDEVDLEPLVEEAIKATLSELDPHSSYITAEDLQRMRASFSGEFTGIGISFISLRDTIIVNRVLEGSPAAKAGVKKNDRIIAVDSTSLVGVSTSEAQGKLRGEKGTTSTLSIVRGKYNNPLYINIKRDDIPTKSVSLAFRLDSNVGYVRIDSFLSRTLAEEFTQQVNTLGSIDALIIDLRNNSGGLLSSAIRLSELFLNRGDLIVSTDGRKENSTYFASKNGAFRKLPLVILTNEETASASEIFAGAMQDHDRAVIIGHRSFGKGLIQRLVNLPDGSGIKLTIARYLTPSGRVIQRPYQNGDRESYVRDRERYNHLDSVQLAELPTYTSLRNGRTIYGGGGIHPDVYVTLTGESLPFVSALRQSKSISEIIVSIFDRVDIDSFLDRYPTLEAYTNDFTLDREAIDLMISRVHSFNPDLTDDPEGLNKAQDIIKAQIAEEVYGVGTYYLIFGHREDQMLKSAHDIASNPASIRTLLGYSD